VAAVCEADKRKMANLIPFRGVLYNPAKVPDISRVVAPPYDVIDAAAQRALYARHPYNIIRLELGLEEPGDSPSHNRYTRAAALLEDWMTRGILLRDGEPALYPYLIDYRSPLDPADAPPKTLKGLFATVELEEFGSGQIYPHETTQAAAKQDRLNLLEACRAHFSAIFALYADPGGRVIQLLDHVVHTTKPRIEFTDDEGFRHRLWMLTDPSVLGEIQAALKAQPLFIADGHHRYETALAYRQRCRQRTGITSGLEPFDKVLMLIASLEDPGLTILPTHRVLTTPIPPREEILRVLGQTCEIEEVAPAELIQTLRDRGRTAPVFALVLPDAALPLLLTVKPDHRPDPGAAARDKLDVSLLHSLVLNVLCPIEAAEHAVRYTKDELEALELVAQGRATGALLLNPTKVGDIQAVAATGERMPPKSTYFFPKPLTGLVMHVMTE
jgi:uncharacterized protein (DUF1015 family)